MKDEPNAGSAFGDALIGAFEEALAHAPGELPGARIRRVARTARNTEVEPPPAYSAEEMRTIRRRLGVSQAVFAKLLNASPSAVRAWEQGQRSPDGPTRRLLQVIERSPDALAGIVSGAKER